MKRLTIMIVASESTQLRQVSFPKRAFQIASILLSGLLILSGYFTFDYIELRRLRASYNDVLAENNSLKGEARVLMNNLETVKSALKKVQDHMEKLGEMTHLATAKLTKKVGIGPLSTEESNSQALHAQAEQSRSSNVKIPLGVDLDQLTFKPIFKQLEFIEGAAEEKAVELQNLLSTLTEQRSLFSSIPTVSPVMDGWITSRFGSRVSPFTGDISQHKGIDIAAPIGTPVYAPADGVVAFVGAKEGFGNFIMLAHGFGVVSGYGHNAQNLVTAGQVVKRGEQIATVGQTGRTTGPHLHYEIWTNGRSSNPERFILNLDEILLAH